MNSNNTDSGTRSPIIFYYDEIEGMEYLRPADRRVFRRLTECDAVYVQLYGLVDSEENGVLRYGKHFYETFYSKRDILLQLLWERAGWRP